MSRASNKPDTWSDHKRIEARSLAMHRKIAARLRSQPSLLRMAKKNVGRWLAQNGAIPTLVEWKELLNPFPRFWQCLYLRLSQREISGKAVLSVEF